MIEPANSNLGGLRRCARPAFDILLHYDQSIPVILGRHVLLGVILAVMTVINIIITNSIFATDFGGVSFLFASMSFFGMLTTALVAGFIARAVFILNAIEHMSPATRQSLDDQDLIVFLKNNPGQFRANAGSGASVAATRPLSPSPTGERTHIELHDWILRLPIFLFFAILGGQYIITFSSFSNLQQILSSPALVLYYLAVPATACLFISLFSSSRAPTLGALIIDPRRIAVVRSNPGQIWNTGTRGVRVYRFNKDTIRMFNTKIRPGRYWLILDNARYGKTILQLDSKGCDAVLAAVAGSLYCRPAGRVC